MIRYEEALTVIQGLSLPNHTVMLPLEKANGYRLAEDLHALVPSPPYTNSAMDGYAVRRAEAVAGALKIRGAVYAKAGAVSDLPAAADGECAKIMTGGALPPWADTVIPVEASAVGADGRVTFQDVPETGANIRRVGDDLTAGSLLLRAGTVLDAERIMVAAAFGHRKLPVRERPRLVFIATGDELVEPGEALAPGAVYNSSKYFLTASAQSLGIFDTPHLTVQDDPEAAAAAIEGQLAKDGTTVLVTTGAVSAGDLDFIPQVAAKLGFKALFHKVAIRPGKPVFLAVRERAVWLGLPGNPISTAVGWHAFVRPLLTAVAGLPPVERRTLVLKNEVRKPENLRCFFRAEVTADKAWVGSRQGSAQLAPSINNEAYVELPEGFTRIPADTRVAAIMI